MSASPLIPEEMRRQYVQRRKTDLSKLIDALAQKDLEVFHRIGHQLKGNASTYGYMDLESIGIRLEEIKSLDDSTEASDLLAEFRAWLATNEPDSGSSSRLSSTL